MPVVSGHAGYSFELSRYFQSGAEALGWKHSMRHRGIDVARPSEDRGAVSTDGLKTVSWLTLLGKSLLVSLGGQRVLSALPSSVIVHDLPTGVALEAGPQPIAGESAKPKDLASYKAVFKVVRPLIERVVARYPAMWLLGGIKIEPTRAWLLRLER
jgi:hypothetical protein